MAGFLSALSFLAPVGQSLGPQLEQASQVQLQQQRQQAFGKMLDELGPEYEPFRQYFKAGGTPHDVMSAIGGPIGAQLREQHQNSELNRIMNLQVPDETDPTGKRQRPATLDEQIRAAAGSNLIDPGTAISDIIKLHTQKEPKLSGEIGTFEEFGQMSPDQQKAFMQFHQLMHPEKPERPRLMQMQGSDIDPNTGIEMPYTDIMNLDTGETRRVPRGTKLGATLQAEIFDAHAVQDQLPIARKAATDLQNALRNVPPDQQEALILNEQNRYNVYDQASRLNPLNPLEAAQKWYGGTFKKPDDVFVRYFTEMGQLQQMSAKPQGILRATRMFDTISTHLVNPAAPPDINLERINTAQDRWSEVFRRMEILRQHGGGTFSAGGVFVPPSGAPIMPGAPSGGAAANAPSGISNDANDLLRDYTR